VKVPAQAPPFFLVVSASPWRPDFRCEFGLGPVGIEVTEATDAQDQKGMTKFQQSGVSQASVGSFGGRFARGAGNPELAWQRDVLEAVRSKSQDLDNYQDPPPGACPPPLLEQ
jgi:hypothetical protein